MDVRPFVPSVHSFGSIHSEMWTKNMNSIFHTTLRFSRFSTLPFVSPFCDKTKSQKILPPIQRVVKNTLSRAKLIRIALSFFLFPLCKKCPLIANKNRRKTYFSPKILEEKPGGISLRSRIYQIQLIETCRNITSGWCHMLKISHISAVRTL